MSEYLSCVQNAIWLEEVRLAIPQTKIYNPMSVHQDIHKYKERYVKDAMPESVPLFPDEQSIPNYYAEEINGRPSLLSKLIERNLPGRLWERQWACFNRTIHCMLRNNVGFVLNTSEQGTGKTFVQFGVALYFDMEMFVLSPLSVNSKWVDKSAPFGVIILFVASYELFQGKVYGTLKHPYLIRHDVPSADDRRLKDRITTFEVTQAFLDLLATRRILFVFDEVQKIKNPSNDISHACFAIVERIPLDCERLKVVCCSRTAMERIEYGETMLRMLGVLRHGRMYQYVAAIGGGHTYATDAWRGMIAQAKSLSPEHTSMILQLNKYVNVKGVRWVAWLLFRDVFRPHLTNEMPKHNLVHVKMDVANGFYTFEPELERLITEQLDAIMECLHMRRNHQGNYEVDMGGLAAAMPHMVELQRLKTCMFVSLTRWYISRVPNAKIILFVTFKDVMKILAEQLSDLGAVVMNGTCNAKKRDVLIQKFMQQDLSCQVMITNPRVGGVGIDLDDKTGKFPRAMFLMLDFSHNDQNQAMWRGLRDDTKQEGDVPALYIRFVYTNTPRGDMELRFLQLYHEKAKIINQVLAQQDAALFPTRNVRYDAEFKEVEDFDHVPLLRKRPSLNKGVEKE